MRLDSFGKSGQEQANAPSVALANDGMQPLRFYHVNYNVVNRVDGKMDSKSVRVYDFKVRV